MAADMCVAVVKYSHATGVKSDNTIPWTHIVATNLFLVLKGEETHIQNGQLVLQVIQGNSALEMIDIGELVDQAVEARYGSQQAGITPQIEQLPIFGIHKEVFLALRYRLPNGQARRVQFRLQSIQECSSMVDILERRGLEFQQQRPRTGRPASARPEAPGTLMRPSTTQTYYAKSTFETPAAPPNSSPFRLQPLEAGGLSSQIHSDASRSQRPDHGTAGQPSLLQTTSKALRQALAGTDTNYASDNDAKRSLSLANTSHSQDLTVWSDPEVPTRPGTMAAQQTASNIMSRDPHSLMYSQPVIERPLTGLSTLSNAKTSHSNSSVADTTNKTSGEDRAQPDGSNSLYQPSAPASLRMPETLEHEMPPRRELPFKRPGSHQSTSSRPSTSARSVTQFTAVQSSDLTSASSTLSPVAKNSNVRPTTASPLRRAVAPVYPEPTKKALTVEGRSQSHAALLPAATPAPVPDHITALEGSFRPPSDLGDLLRAKRQSAERSASISKVARTDSTADAEYELETPPGTSSSPTKPHAQIAYSSPSRTAVGMATSVNKLDSPQRPTSPVRNTNPEANANSVFGGPAQRADAASLADYASQSREDRQTVLDEFMVSKLADPNFAVLCEDLDSCWRRIALGL